MRRLNKESLDLIKDFEGLRLKAYYDIANVLTIGYGHTNRAGTWKFDANTVITEQKAEDILRLDLGKAKEAVDRYVKVELNDNEYGALVSLIHNIGPTGFAKSTVVRRLNAGNRNGAAQAILMWNKATVKGAKREVRGLTRRRKAEMALFLKPAYKSEDANFDIVSETDVENVGESATVQAYGGEMKPLTKSKTNWLSGLGLTTIIGQGTGYIQELAPFIKPEYVTITLIVIFGLLILNRVSESREGEH